MSGKRYTEDFKLKAIKQITERGYHMNPFRHLQEVRSITQEWILKYNEQRPHESLAGLQS